MKKKSPRGIPDFSAKGPKSKKSMPTDKDTQPNQPRTNVANINVKPQATSQKSGRRGS